MLLVWRQVLLLIWIFIIFVCILIIKKHKSHQYKPSQYYDKSSFPMQIIYKTNGYNIKNATKSIQYAITHYNTTLNYKLFTYDQNDNTSGLKITIQNTTYSHGCGSRFDGYGGVLAHATVPPHRLLCIDVSELWNYRQDNHRLFRRVLIHELGHILGLEHAFDMDSVMSYDDIYTLRPYDIKCIKQIYPFI